MKEVVISANATVPFVHFISNAFAYAEARSGFSLSLASVGAWLILMRWLRGTGYTIAVIALPGTVLHELAHFVVGFLLGARPVSLSLIPRRSGPAWVLGSVAFERLTILNACFVAFAPLLLLGVASTVFLAWVHPSFASHNYFRWVAATYVCACTLFSCIPSWTDIRIGAASTFLYGIVAASICGFVLR